MKNCPRCGFQFVSRIPLTKRQTEVYGYVVEFTRIHSYAPSFEEIAEQFNYNSLSTVHEHLGNLERKGYIDREFNQSRAITCLVALDELSMEPVGEVGT